jgi:hypothetical protein
MNVEQAKSAARWLISVAGPFLVARGYIAADGGVEMWSALILSAIPLVWSMFVHTQTNAVAVVDAIAKDPNSPVKAIVTESTIAGRELAQALPGKTTVIAGTAAAAAAASLHPG